MLCLCFAILLVHKIVVGVDYKGRRSYSSTHGAFYHFRKGKVKPLDIVEKDDTGRFLQLFTNMGKVYGDVNLEVASEFVCKVYGQIKEQNVDEARYSKLMQMSGKVDKVC